MPILQEQSLQIDAIVARFRKRGFRITPQRLAILKTLVLNREHLSVEEIYDRVHLEHPMISLATVYKTITLLKEMGEITELNLNNHYARYERMEDHPHPHFICSQCGQILDLEAEMIANLPLRIAQETGLEIIKTRLDFYGICHQCQSEK
jgi:Fur family peroxide stress response transcriptional regulator